MLFTLRIMLVFSLIGCIYVENKDLKNLPSRGSYEILPLRHIQQKIYRRIKTTTTPKPRPFTKASNWTTVTVHTGTTAILPCQVGIENVTVIWVKTDPNISILTINEVTRSNDKRFYATINEDLKIWYLHISFTKKSDIGLYECQVCSSPTSSIYTQLKLIDAYAKIIGDNPKEVFPGAPLRLSCELKNSIQGPDYIFWYHNDRMINYDLEGGAAIRYGRQGSELIFPWANHFHAGNYSCVPSNAKQANVQVIGIEKEVTAEKFNEIKAVSFQGHNVGSSFWLGLAALILNLATR